MLHRSKFKKLARSLVAYQVGLEQRGSRGFSSRPTIPRLVRRAYSPTTRELPPLARPPRRLQQCRILPLSALHPLHYLPRSASLQQPSKQGSGEPIKFHSPIPSIALPRARRSTLPPRDSTPYRRLTPRPSSQPAALDLFDDDQEHSSSRTTLLVRIGWVCSL